MQQESEQHGISGAACPIICSSKQEPPHLSYQDYSDARESDGKACWKVSTTDYATLCNLIRSYYTLKSTIPQAE